MYWPAPEESELSQSVATGSHVMGSNGNRHFVCPSLPSLMGTQELGPVEFKDDIDQFSAHDLLPEVTRGHSVQPGSEVNPQKTPSTSHRRDNKTDDGMGRFVTDFHQYSLSAPE